MASDGNGQGVDRESTDGEENENDFGEHNGRARRKKEQIATAPGLKFKRQGRGAGVSCTAAEERRE